MAFEVRFSDEASANVREIRDSIAERSRDGALRWLEALENVRTRLTESAEGFGLAPESDVFDEELHQVFFRTRRGNTYRALFVIRPTVVHVVSVRGPGQNLLQSGEIQIPE